MEEFNEEQAIEYIRTQLSDESNEMYSDDEILIIIDIIFEYYDVNGLLDINVEDDDELDVDDLISYVQRMVAKDKESPVTPEDVEIIVNAELDYEESIDE